MRKPCVDAATRGQRGGAEPFDGDVRVCAANSTGARGGMRGAFRTGRYWTAV